MVAVKTKASYVRKNILNFVGAVAMFIREGGPPMHKQDPAKPAAAVSVDKTRRALHRSPNYPAFSLEEAISKARTVYEMERRAWTTAGVIQKHLGYQKPSGTGGRALSALRQYGLLDDQSGKYRISESAYHLLVLPESEPAWIGAVKQAAQKPVIFAELMAEYVGGLPSDDTLRTVLITQRRFNPASVPDFIRIFRRTVEYAARLGPDAGAADSAALPIAEESHAGELPVFPTLPNVPSAAGAKQGERSYAWPLSIPRNIRAELKITGDELRASDIERLKKQIDLLLEALAEDPETE